MVSVELMVTRCAWVERLFFNNKGNRKQTEIIARKLSVHYNKLPLLHNNNINHYFIITSFSTTILAATLSA